MNTISPSPNSHTHTHTHDVSMKLQASQLPLPKYQTIRKIPKLIPLIALTLLLTTLSIYYPFLCHNNLSFSLQIGYQHQDTYSNTIKSTYPLHPQPKPNNPTRRSRGDTTTEKPPPVEKVITGVTVANKTVAKKCDLFNGEWIPNPDGPYYTNETCNTIQEHQNCMKFGRPDTGYLKWRWKPDECELPLFDPYKFLEMMRGKSILFVGDSIARNHMQSLICLLSKVREAVDASEAIDENRVYEYRDYNFNISIISSPYLIRTRKTDPNDFTRPYHLFLDEFDDTWTARIHQFHYLIISAGQWFFRPSYFYLNRSLAGCLYCSDPNVTHLPFSFSYRRAFRTAFRAINAAAGSAGVAFLRTVAPSHFEGGPWDKGGDCRRRGPFRRKETALEDSVAEMYRIQVEELGIAGKETGGNKLRLFDATKAMALRADGHPSKYGRRAGVNQTFPNDCVHWCLPGPIDAWSDFLQELLRREEELNAYYQS